MSRTLEDMPKYEPNLLLNYVVLYLALPTCAANSFAGLFSRFGVVKRCVTRGSKGA